MNSLADAMALDIEHDIEGHERPAWDCPECEALLRAQAAVARHEQDVLGYCHDGGIAHAWYHKHRGTWVRPAEARPFA